MSLLRLKRHIEKSMACSMILLVFCAVPVAAAPADRLTVLVFPVAGSDVPAQLAEDVVSGVEVALCDGGVFSCAQRSVTLKKALDEMRLQSSGAVIQAVVRIGAIEGARLLIPVRIYKMDGEYVAQARMVNIESALYVPNGSYEVAADSLRQLLLKTRQELAPSLSKQARLLLGDGGLSKQ